MEIRSLDGPEDLRGAIRAHGNAWREAYRGIVSDDVLDRIAVDPTDERIREWYERVRDDRDGFLVAVDDDGTTRGYAYFRWGANTKAFVGPNEAGLKEIYVHPGYWNRGVGTRLLERGLERLPDEVDRLKLEVLADNDVGRGFYETRGFEPVAESEVEIGGESYPTNIYARDVDCPDSG